MKIHSVSLGLALSVVGLLGTGDAGAGETPGWRIEGGGSGIVDGQKYSLFNLDQKRYWGYQDRDWANLGWDGAANQGMMIARKGGNTGPLKCGDVFALFIEKEWVIYEKQKRGINLSTRTKLADDAWYQWMFSCPAGQTVPLNTPVTLTNMVAQDVLVGCKRTWGNNVCWNGDVVTIRGKNYRKGDVPFF